MLVANGGLRLSANRKRRPAPKEVEDKLIAADASACERKLNRLAYDLYGLDASDIALIEKTAVGG